MINGIEGIPGSGKSYEATVFHVLVALQSGRKVITNLPLNVEMFAAIDPSFRLLLEIRRRCQPIRGTWDAARVDVDSGQGNAFEFFEDGHKEDPAVNVSLFGHVWDYFSIWKHPKTGQGPLFVIDECHVALPKVGTDKQVIEWFKLSRHFNADVLLMTQSFRDMNSMIAGLLAILVKVRKADILGKADHYIRKVHGGYRGAVISTEQRKYEPQYFALYKSHTQGNSVMEAMASDVAPFFVKFNRFRNALWIVILVAVAWAVWHNTSSSKKKHDAAEVKARMASAAKDVKPAALEFRPEAVKPAMQVKPDSSPVAAPAQSEDPEPFASKDVHLTGMMRMGSKVVFTFTVSKGGTRIVDLTQQDVLDAGYTWRPTGHCTGVLEWKGTRKAVTCDAPRLAAGDDQRPHVVAVPGASGSQGAPGGGAPPAGMPPGAIGVL